MVGLSFMDLTDADVSAEGLAEETLNIKGVKNVEAISPEIGGLTVLFNRRVKAEETKCIASGDPYCEFAIKPA